MAKHTLLLKNKDKILYPDADASARVSYGKIESVKPQEALTFNYYTTLNGVKEKYDSNLGDEQFYMPKKLQKLLTEKDFGIYANKNGELPVNFLISLHTTSGNSGSPILNKKGELIGLNFDRIWQGTSSDYFYVPELCRSIAVDIRYILFLIDKYSPSSYVIKELNLN